MLVEFYVLRVYFELAVPSANPLKLFCGGPRARKVRHDIAWFDKEESAVGVLTSRLEADASSVSVVHPTLSIPIHPRLRISVVPTYSQVPPASRGRPFCRCLVTWLLLLCVEAF